MLPAGTPGSIQSLLNEIEAKVAAEVQAGRLPVVVFDLDDTLFDTRARHVWIMKRYAERVRESSPADAAALDRTRFEDMDYAVDSNLDTVRFSKDPAKRDRFKRFWVSHFFGDLCAIDPEIPGGSSYVRRLHQKGALIVYLTGRDPGRMLRGTIESLKHAAMPIGIARTELVMKPDRKLDDETFKAGVTAYLGKLGTVVAAFENEPFNINVLAKAFPKASAVLLTTRHKPGAPAASRGVKLIPNFLR